MSELKPPRTYSEQVDKLAAHGCRISDRTYCEDILKKVNYYRIIAYMLPFKYKDTDPCYNVSFETVFNLYEFDRRMRNIILRVLEEIEIYTRTQLAYYHAHKYGADGYMDPQNFNKRHQHLKFESRIRAAVSENQDILFVKHHLNKYQGLFPTWVIVELFSFGMLSHFYGDMKRADQIKIANTSFGIDCDVLRSWLRCCTDLRNICAHYGRLYYRKFSAIPRKIATDPLEPNRDLFSQLIMLKHLYPDKAGWDNNITLELQALCERYESWINYDHIGFPKNWSSLLSQ